MNLIRPLSDMQQSMLAHESLAERSIYTMPLLFELVGPLDLSAFQTAVVLLLARHPVLTCTYDYDGARPAAMKCDSDPVRVVRAPTPRCADDALSAFWEEPFDLAAASAFRALLIVRDEHQYLFAVAVHHVAGDSWSLALLLRELSSLYSAERRGTRSSLTAAPDFFEYAERERDQHWDLAWWRAQLAGAPMRALELTPCPGEYEGGAFLTVPLRVGGVITAAVRRTAQRLRVTTAAVFLTAVSTSTAAEYTLNESTVGLPVALRDTERLQSTVGPLLNTLPIRTTWDAAMDSCSLIGLHAKAMREALAHKELPYSRIQRAARRSANEAGGLYHHTVNFDTETLRLRLLGMRSIGRPVAPKWATFPALWDFSWSQLGDVRAVLRMNSDNFNLQQALDTRDRFDAALAQLLGVSLPSTPIMIKD